MENYQEASTINRNDPKNSVKMIKNHIPKKQKKIRRIPMARHVYPMIASMMPMDLNTERHQNF